MKVSFPKNFAWGAATASYQIEGGAKADGKGPSVWDMMCRRSDAIWMNQNGSVTCDHYHRWREDVALMKEIGLGAYRMSVCWPRVLPDGTGKVNAKGLAFYDRLVDALLEAGVTPYITLFHWDYPHALFCRGGWLNRDSADWFADYAKVLAERLGDRVKNWITLNEPQCFVGLGHSTGTHAPGLRLPWAEVLRVGHHAMLAHGRAVQVLRAAGGRSYAIGYAPVGVCKYPATARPADVRAARQAIFSEVPQSPWNNAWWMDPVIKGQYPADGLKLYKDQMDFVRPGDLKIISTPIDFLGLNIYAGGEVKAGPGGKPVDVPMPDGKAQTHFNWFVNPEVLEWSTRFYYERYRKPIILTENGMSNTDWVSLDGKVHDPQRIDFVARYLQALKRAIDAGVDVRGYFQWSLMDNFEWAEGYKQRFGMIHVDYPTGRRTLKDSARWYGEVIRSNGASLFPSDS